MFSFHENLWPGDAPGPPERHFRAPRGGRPAWSVPRKPQAERRSRMIGVRAGPDRRTGLPDLLRALRPPVLPVSGAGGARPSDRAVWTGFVPPPLPSGVGGDLTPAGGTDGVRAGGRGDRRRSGSNTDHVARRSLRGFSRAADWHRPVVIGRRRENIRRRADRGTFCPQPRMRPERGLCRGSEGARPPASLRRGLTECGPTEYAGLAPVTGPKPARRRRRNRLSGHGLEQRRPGRRRQAPRPLGRQLQGRRGGTLRAPAARSYSGLPGPLGDRRSSLSGDPLTRRLPEMPPERPEMGGPSPCG